MKLSALGLCLLPLSALAQQLSSVPAIPQMVIKGSDIADRIAKSAVPDPTGSVRQIETLLQQGTYRVNLEYHAGASGVGLNEDVAAQGDSLFGGVSGIRNADEIQPVRATPH